MKIASIKDAVSHLCAAGLFNVFGAGVINRLLSFLSGLIIVRLIPQEAYGVYSYAYTALNIILLFNGIGAASAILQFASERAFSDRCEEVEAFGLRLGLLFDVFLALILLLLPSVVELPVAGSGRLLRMWFLLPFFQFFCDVQTTSLRSALKNREYAIATNINTAFILVFSTGGAFLGGSVGLIFGRTIAYAITALAVFSLYRVPRCLAKPSSLGMLSERIRSKDKALDAGERRSFLAIAVTTAVNSGINQLVYYLGVAIVGTLTEDATSVALFQTALAVPTALDFIPQTLALFVYPYFARHKDEANWVLRRYCQVTVAAASMALGIALFFFFLADWVVGVLYGKDYLAGASIVRILMIGWFFSASLRSIACNLLVTQRRLVYGVAIGILSATVLIVASYSLIPLLGINGAAWAQVAVYLITGIAYSAYFLFVMVCKARKQQNEAIHG